MDVRKTIQGPAAVLSLNGAMVGDQLSVLETEVQLCLDSGALHVLLELSHVPFIDSAGLERLLATAAELGRRGGGLCIAGLNDTCSDILAATRLSSLIQISADIDSALRSLP